jgi:hypothetical protein
MVNIDLQSLARALGGEVSSNQVLAPGPGHSAKDRSLSVKLDADAPDGFIVHSFAHDDAIECKDFVRAKLSLPAFKPNGSGGRRRRASTADISNMLAAAIELIDESEPAGRVVAAYPYKDAMNTLLYEVLRYEPKKFRGRRPDGNGGWIPDAGERRVLYRLPELLKYPDACVFVCEGEKDADRVASLDHCAVTVAFGDWKPDCIAALAGRDVLILQDVDKNETGRKKALTAATALYGTASTIRIVALPGLTGEPGNKDVSDWLDADPRRADKLVDICFDAPPWAPDSAEAATAATSDDQGTAGDHDGGDDNADTNSDGATSPRTPWTVPVLPWRDPEMIPRRVFLYGHYYARGFVSATIADGGIGKSLLKIAEFLACATGLPLLDITPTERVRVLYWNGDDPYVEVERRIHAACQHYEIDLKKLLEERWLFVGTRDKQPLCIAETKGRSVAINQNAVGFQRIGQTTTKRYSGHRTADWS